MTTEERRTESDQGRLEQLVARLSLEQKVRLLTGKDFWSTWPEESIGLRSIVVSDGPSGVRGPRWDEREPSLNLPSATAVAASWDVDLARRTGEVAAAEARRKGVDVVLGPTINLHRSPLGGRHFEAFSEDPVLTADLGAAVVEGLQSRGVGATPKHYIANDFETDRFTVDVQVDERTLREVYLRAFETAVVRAKAWLVMSAYNSINGATASENPLLEAPLNDEWGFDGVVVSDWTAVRSVESAKHDQDLAMPGPDGAWGDALAAAVRAGEVPEEAIDRKVVRLLRLAERVGALEGAPEPWEVPPVAGEEAARFIRDTEIAGMVLAQNDGVLPLGREVASIAVIGQNALAARTQGGGSATVLPDKVVSPLEGVRDAFPDASITFSLGAIVQQGISELPLEELANPGGGAGVRVTFLDPAGAELLVEDRRATRLIWLGGDAPLAQAEVLRFETTWTPPERGRVGFGFAAPGGHVRVQVGDRVLLDEDAPVLEGDPAAFLAPPSVTTPLEVEAGVPLPILIDFRYSLGEGLGAATGFAFGTEPVDVDPDALIDGAARAAAEADVVLLVVGTSSEVESEGFDRQDLALPGRQDDLARAVLAVNPRTVVVVNSGAPVALPWREDAAAVLLGWFGGQEFGHAVAAVLSGEAEPGGRLPTTWPGAQADVPVIDVTPVDGVVRYEEGVHIGYRAWLKAGTAPAYPFGSGLGYTTWALEALTADSTARPGGSVSVSVRVTNTGERPGKHVVQVYASRPDSTVDRPVRWLVAFAPVFAEPGETVELRLAVAARDLAHWDGGWQYEAGDFTLTAGSSVEDLPLSATVRLQA
jgi:beta-glucosidase